jgi:signal transduction histidine kinase
MGATSIRKARTLPADSVGIDENAADVAHVLANLVQVVSGNLELIAGRTTDEHALRYLENARAAARQLEELARQLRGD